MKDTLTNNDETICLIEFSSNTTHIRAVNLNNGVDIIPAQSTPTRLGTFPPGTRDLNPHGVRESLKILRDNQDILDTIPAENIRVVGTGALRDASNTHEFKQAVKQELGLPIDVISGAEEAHYSAAGVMSSFDAPNGVIWDMGGRSSEFAIIKDGNVSACISLPLGSQAIREQEDIHAYIQEQLDTLPDAYTKQSFDNLYVIGGTPRRILASHQNMTNPDGENKIHGYQTDKQTANDFTQSLLNTDPDELGDDPRFRDYLPFAGGLFAALLDKIDTENVVASKSGTRAGVLYELEEEVIKSHPDLGIDPTPEAEEEYIPDS